MVGLVRNGGSFLINGGEKGGPVSANFQASIPVEVVWVFYDLKSFSDFTLVIVFFICNDFCVFKAYMVVCLTYMFRQG